MVVYEGLVEGCGFFVVVVEEAAVAVDVGVGSFLDDCVDGGGVELGMEFGADGVLDAMVWPKNLGKALELNEIA